MTDTRPPTQKASNGTATRVTASHSDDEPAPRLDGLAKAGGIPASDGAESSTAPQTPAASAAHGDKDKDRASSTKSSGKRRRKVNHACIYCRRSHMTCDLERPCTRCVKRNIGHLCHDEPREPAKRPKSEPHAENESPKKPASLPAHRSMNLSLDPPARSKAGPTLERLPKNRGKVSLGQLTPVPAPQLSALADNSRSLSGFNDWNLGAQSNLLHDMHNFHPHYSFGTSEVSNEYNLLNDFLTHSMLEGGNMYSNEEQVSNFLPQDAAYPSTMQMLNNNLLVPNVQSNRAGQMGPPGQAGIGSAIAGPASGFPAVDKAREAFYLAAADPSGNEPPEIRMKKLMKAKFDAGLLKPFNYVKGYARLLEYMNKHLHPQSRTRIIRQLDQFRPRFRERMQGLTDMQLVYVEVAFERRLMEYDRVFASMAIPACCWRRTGEIYRGNNEMARLLGVSIETLRDGKIAIHDVFAENSLVSYWEKFGHIAFDSSQKAILTSCVLRTKDANSPEPELRCCFSFTIRRDEHHVPFLIVGNFLPIIAAES